MYYFSPQILTTTNDLQNAVFGTGTYAGNGALLTKNDLTNNVVELQKMMTALIHQYNNHDKDTSQVAASLKFYKSSYIWSCY